MLFVFFLSGNFGDFVGNGGFGAGGICDIGGMGGFGNHAAAAALMRGFNPAAFGGFGPGAMNFGPFFGFNGMGFGGFQGFDPGGFGDGGGGKSNVSLAVAGSSGTGESSSGGYEGISSPMASAYGSYPGFVYEGFPSTGDWNQFALAAAAAGGRAGGSGRGPGDYQMGSYSQMNSSYGPTNRRKGHGANGRDKNNRGFRPY